MNNRRQLDRLKTSEDYAEDRGLTSSEKKFCYEYIIDNNVTRASERAEVSRVGAQKMLKRKRVLDFIEHLQERNKLSSLGCEPKMLKGQRMIWANCNFDDYKDILYPDDLSKLTRAQLSCIKAINYAHTKDGLIYIKKIELYDADRSNEILAKPHGIYDQIKIDLSLLDLIDPDDIERLSKKYGWGDNGDN